MKANDILVYLRTDISDTGEGILGKTSLQMLFVEMCIDMLLYTKGDVSQVSPPDSNTCAAKDLDFGWISVVSTGLQITCPSLCVEWWWWLHFAANTLRCDPSSDNIKLDVP